MKSICKPFCRYPGGKSRHVQKILQYFEADVKDYREPFLGGGSVFLAGGFRNAWLNDIDEGVADMWKMVKESPNQIEALINKHTLILDHQNEPHRIKEAIDLWRQVRENRNGLFPNGYRELFLIKTCFSGVKTGGPTGGIEQKSQWPITARWSAKSTIERVKTVSEILKSCKITNTSWESVLSDVSPQTCVFLDPPYLEKGAMCYKHSFGKEHHEKLAESLASKDCRFVVTLDNCDGIKKIWSAYFPPENFVQEEWMYSMTASRGANKIGKELFITDMRSLEMKLERDKNGRNKHKRKVPKGCSDPWGNN